LRYSPAAGAGSNPPAGLFKPAILKEAVNDRPAWSHHIHVQQSWGACPVPSTATTTTSAATEFLGTNIWDRYSKKMLQNKTSEAKVSLCLLGCAKKSLSLCGNKKL
jgi:hypothetical protein